MENLKETTKGGRLSKKELLAFNEELMASDTIAGRGLYIQLLIDKNEIRTKKQILEEYEKIFL